MKLSSLILFVISFALIESAKAQITPQRLEATKICESAEKLMENGKFEEAYTLAYSALKKDETYYKPYFIGGVSLYKQGLFSSAKESLQNARKFAKGEELEMVEGVLKVMEDEKVYKELMLQADKAFYDRANIKAANLYDKAWKLFTTRTEPGFKAVELYIQNEDYLNASKILSVIKNSDNSGIALKAAKIFSNIEKFIIPAGITQLEEGVKQFTELTNYTKAEEIFLNLYSAWPDNVSNLTYLCRLYALLENNDKFKLFFKELLLNSKSDSYLTQVIFTDLNCLSLISNENLLQMIKDYKSASITDRVEEAMLVGELQINEIYGKWHALINKFGGKDLVFTSNRKGVPNIFLDDWIEITKSGKFKLVVSDSLISYPGESRYGWNILKVSLEEIKVSLFELPQKSYKQIYDKERKITKEIHYGALIHIKYDGRWIKSEQSFPDCYPCSDVMISKVFFRDNSSKPSIILRHRLYQSLPDLGIETLFVKYEN